MGLRGKGRSNLKVRRGVRGRHGSRGWPVRVPEMVGGGGDVWRVRQSREEEEETDMWARARKKKKVSLKFETKVFTGSKIHQFFYWR